MNFIRYRCNYLTQLDTIFHLLYIYICCCKTHPNATFALVTQQVEYFLGKEEVGSSSLLESFEKGSLMANLSTFYYTRIGKILVQLSHNK